MTYQLCTWDHEGQRWDVEQEAASLFALRQEIRCYRRCWADYNLLVRRKGARVGRRRRKNGYAGRPEKPIICMAQPSLFEKETQ